MNSGSNVPGRQTRSASTHHSSQGALSASTSHWSTPTPPASGTSRYPLQQSPPTQALTFAPPDHRAQYQLPSAPSAVPRESSHAAGRPPLSGSHGDDPVGGSRGGNLEARQYQNNFYRSFDEPRGDYHGGRDNFDDRTDRAVSADRVDYPRQPERLEYSADNETSWSAGAAPSNPFVHDASPALDVAPSQSLISSDLHNRIVSAFELSDSAERRLEGFASLMSCVPGIGKETTIPIFYNLGASLRIIDLLDRQALEVPLVTEMTSMYQKIDSRLSSTTAVVSVSLVKNIRSLVKSMLVDPKRFDYSQIFSKVKARLASEQVKYKLVEHFKDTTATEAVHAKCSKIVSSQLGAFREDIIKSVLGGEKKPPQSLAQFTLSSQAKYRSASTGGSSTLTINHLAHRAVLRRFVIDHPNAKNLAEAAPPEPVAKKRKHHEVEGDDESDASEGLPSASRSQGSTSSRSESPMSTQSGATAGVRMGNLVDWEGNVVNCPEFPAQAHFWRVFEWHLQIVRIQHGEVGTPGWKKYIAKIIDEDEDRFNPTGDNFVAGVSELLARVDSDQSTTPPAAPNDLSSVPVDFSGTQV